MRSAVLTALALVSSIAAGCDSAPQPPKDASLDHHFHREQFVKPSEAGLPVCPRIAHAREPIAPQYSMALSPPFEQLTFGYPVNTWNSYEVAGNILVYAADNVSPHATHAAIVNIEQRQESIVHRADYGEGCTWVDTDGQSVAYVCGIFTDELAIPFSVIRYDPLQDREELIDCIVMRSPANSTYVSHVAVADTGIAVNAADFVDGGDILFHRFGTTGFEDISSKPASRVVAEGASLVWGEVAKGRTTLNLYDTHTRTTRAFANIDGESSPAFRIRGTKVVWVGGRTTHQMPWTSGGASIYLHDLSTGQTTRVASNPGKQANPDVWSNWVVWEDYNNEHVTKYNNASIHAKNMTTGVEYTVADDSSYVRAPRVDNGHVFFLRDGYVVMAPLSSIEH